MIRIEFMLSIELGSAELEMNLLFSSFAINTTTTVVSRGGLVSPRVAITSVSIATCPRLHKIIILWMYILYEKYCCHYQSVVPLP